MTNEQLKALRDGGMDVDKTIERFSGNADMYERFLKKFPNDESYAQIAPRLCGQRQGGRAQRRAYAQGRFRKSRHDRALCGVLQHRCPDPRGKV